MRPSSSPAELRKLRRSVRRLDTNRKPRSAERSSGKPESHPRRGDERVRRDRTPDSSVRHQSTTTIGIGALRGVTEDYIRRTGLAIKIDHGVDNIAMAESLVLSTGGLALMAAYIKSLLPPSVVSRPLYGKAPTIDVAVGYSKANTSPILRLFLSRMDELIAAAKTNVRL